MGLERHVHVVLDHDRRQVSAETVTRIGTADVEVDGRRYAVRDVEIWHGRAAVPVDDVRPPGPSPTSSSSPPPGVRP